MNVPAPVLERPEGTTFEDVLSEYQQLNDRLARVAAPLRTQNATLCTRKIRDPGFTTHRLEDYPEPLQPVAKELLGITDAGLFIRAVRPGTSAEDARLEPGDQILAINENRISQDPIMNIYNRAVVRNGFDSIVSKVKIKTITGQEFVARIRPDTACDIPMKVIYSQNVNGHTDGQDVLVTSALMRAVPDDTNLALVVAHEMAHIMAGHAKRAPNQLLELEADRMALVLMARAGYNVEQAVSYWQKTVHPHDGGSIIESSHPSTRARYENFAAELKRIQNIEDLDALGFN